MTDPRKKQPMVLPNYPYRGAFTNEQVFEALDRKDRLVELLMDPVGPDGCLINIPVDMMHILAFHLAYAGADTHTDPRRLIESRVRRTEGQMFEVYEWRPVGSFGDDPGADTTEAGSEAAALAVQMKSQLTPEVRAALMEIMRSEFEAVTVPPPSRLEAAQNIVVETRGMSQTLSDESVE